MIKRKEKKNMTILKIIICLLIFITILISYACFIGTKGLFVKEYTIEANIPSNFDGLKIVHISDIHYGRTTKEKELKKLVEKVNLLNPDIIVLTGDILDKNLEVEDSKEMLTKYLKEMNAKIGKYAINGNHDLKYDYWKDIIADSDFKNLNNTFEPIYYDGYDSIVLAGLSSYFDTQNTEEKLKDYHNFISQNEIKYKILLLHEPDTIDEINEDFDLILAGHSHNGQVRLPLIGAIILPKGSKRYYDEYYEVKNAKLYISSGVGTSGLPIRLLDHPSINFYRINTKK